MLDEVEHGRECYERRAWSEAYCALSAADRVTPLSAPDLERLATAAYLTARDLEFQELLERLHRGYVEADDPERAARALAARFDEVVVTLGAEGALWTDGCETVRCDAVPVEAVVDSTGAGDAFAAGLLAARMDGAVPDEALAAGARLAARAVAQAGGRP